MKRTATSSQKACSLFRAESLTLLKQAVAVCLLLISMAALGQNWQFGFDATGNLQAQTTEAPALPQILGQPQIQVVQPGATASFSVVAQDTSGLSYQWRFNGANIPAATSDALLLSNVTTNNQGFYSVVLSSSSGSVTSSPAPLWIDSRGCGMPDSWQLAYFGNLNQNPTGDFDGDGVSNLQEFLDGTNPTNRASAMFRLTIFSNGGTVQTTPNSPSFTNGTSVLVTATAFAPFTFRGWGGDIQTTNNPISLTMTNNKSLIAYTGPINIVWTNSASGDWSAAANWSPNVVPAAYDDVLINTFATVTVNTNADCRNLTLSSASQSTLSVNGTLTLHGNSVWNGGTLGGSGRVIVAPGATLIIPNGGASVFLSSCTLDNAGTILWVAGQTFSMNSGAVITNRAGAVFVAQVANTLGGSGTHFDNVGTFRASANGQINFSANLNNYGEVDVVTGTLDHNASVVNNGIINLSPGTTNQLAGSGSATGSFTAPAGAVVLVSGNGFLPAFNFNSGVQLLGAGLYQLIGGTVNLNTDLAVENLDYNTTLNGVGTLTVSNVMNWFAGGSINGNGVNSLVIPVGATLNLVNSGAIFFNSRTLDNGGTVSWSGAGSMQMSGAVITNRAGALFRIQNGASITGSGRFDNVGLFRKSVTTSVSTIGVPFNNYSTVDLQTGGLTFSGGGANVSGNITVPASTSLGLGGTFTSDGASSITGAGSLTVNNGTASLAGLVNLSGTNSFSGGTANLTGNYICTNNTLNIYGTAVFNGTGTVSPWVVNLGGTLDGANSVTVGSLMNWTGGTMQGSGRTLITSGATMNIASPFFTMTLTSRTLENAGTVVWTGGGGCYLTSAVITNRPGALFDAQNASSLFGASGRFDNAGTFRKEINSAATTFDNNVAFNNYGTVDIRTGLVVANHGYTSGAGALLNCLLGGTAAGTGYGQLQVSGAVTLNGSVSVALANGYIPTTNDTYSLLTAGSRNGTFGSFSYPSYQVTMQTSNTANSVLALVTAVTPYRGIDLTDPVQASADPDGDRLSNLLEYALGTDPRNPADGSTALTIANTPSGGSQYVTMQFKRRLAGNGLVLQYVPEVSGDGQTWFSDAAHVVELSAVPLDGQFEWVTVRDTTPTTPANSREIRLRVDEN